MVDGKGFSFIQQWMNLIGLLKYGIAFSALLIFLPLSAIKGMPLHALLGGLFLELGPLEILLASIFLMGATWSVMFTEGLIVNGMEARWRRGGRAFRHRAQILRSLRSPTRHVPGWAEDFFSVPVTLPQLVFFTLLAAPGLVVIIWHGRESFFGIEIAWLLKIIKIILGTAGAAIGILAAYGVMALLCLPAVLVDRKNPPLVDQPPAERIWWRLSCETGQRLFKGLRRWISRLLWFLHLRYLLEEVQEEDGPRWLVPADHFFAVTNVLALVVVLAAVAFWLHPAQGWEAPAIMYLYIVLTLLIWIFATLDFHLGRLRFSPLVALLLFVVVMYQFFDTDHYYSVRSRTKEERMSPVDVAKANKDEENLVVVAASGGGIWAAGWTTLALDELTKQRPELKREIRLLSAISGSSVAAAYYADGLLRNPPDTPDLIHLRSTASSLGAAAYGFAFLDFWRLISGGLLPLSGDDRGALLEQEWARIAAGSVDPRTKTVSKGTGSGAQRDLLSLRKPIKDGLIPAIIFGATVMESGRRVMITPIDFEGRGKRAETLSEFLFDGKEDADMSLWTAARLSSTFAYVSPAARAKFREKEPKGQQRHHIIDGGYYDDFGVTSALDWLEPVLEALQRGAPLRFKRVLIIQLRAFPKEEPKDVPPKAGSVAALLGPLIGLERIRNGAALARDEIDVDRFINSWDDRLSGQVKLCTVILQPPSYKEEPKFTDEEPPLSWHLTEAQKKILRDYWRSQKINQAVSDLKGFLKGGECRKEENRER